jgi:hypothetical protein
MINRLRVAAIAFRLALLLPLVSSDTAWSGGLANLSGSWKLNKDLSDDPQQKMKDARSESGGGGSSGGGRSGGHRGGGMGRGGRSSDSGNDDDTQRSTFEDAAASSALLKIQHEDPALSIVDGLGRQHQLYTDGRKVEEQRSLGGTTQIRANWKDGRIVVTTEPERGPKITDTYAVAADGSQLTVTTRIEGHRGHPVEIRRVYDAVKPAPAPPPPEDDESISTGASLASTGPSPSLCQV